MTIRRSVVLVSLVFTLAFAQTMEAMAKKRYGRRGARPGVTQLVAKRPMIFFVAKGAPNSCGPGCDEWIAADGYFTNNTPEWFEQFLNSLPRQDMPVYFNSPGGYNRGAIGVGYALRHHGMTAGVGRTVPVGCRTRRFLDSACRKLVRSRHEHRARLVLSHAVCASGCVYALIGATSVNIARDARIGVHAVRVSPVLGQRRRKIVSEQEAVATAHNILRKYAMEMGVDARLVDIAARTSWRRIRWLSRRDLVKLGILAQEPFETSWQFVRYPKQKFFAIKSLTRIFDNKRQTTAISLACHSVDEVRLLVLRDLLAASERISISNSYIQLISDGYDIWTSGGEATSAGYREVRSGVVSIALLQKAASNNDVVLKEVFNSKTEWETNRTAKLSTKTLKTALAQMSKHCGQAPSANNVSNEGGVAGKQ